MQFGGGTGLARACPLWPLGNGSGVRGKNKKPRVLILMSDTGGGHRASAEAIKAGFEEKFGDKYHVGLPVVGQGHACYLWQGRERGTRVGNWGKDVGCSCQQ
jgi:hypothetical protein